MQRIERSEHKKFTLQEAAHYQSPPRLVIAEDDQILRELLANALRGDGYHVIEVADGSELLDTLGSALLKRTEEPIDLIISDVHMPHWNGLTILRHLRQADWSMMPFILITAFGDEEVYQEAKRIGVSAVFDKPFDIDDLRTAVMNIVSPN